MTSAADELEQLRLDNEALRLRLEEAEDTLAAIRRGDVDALVVGNDIYTLDRAQTASNRLRQDVLAQMHDAVLAFDLQQHLIFMNPAAERQYGVPASEALGRLKSDVFSAHWGDEDVPEAGRRLLQQQTTFTGQMVHRGADGDEVHMDAAVSMLRNAQGEVSGTLYVLRDITERVRAEKALAVATVNLARRERQFATLLENLPDIVARSDRQGRFVYVSPSVENFTGRSAQDYLGHTVAELRMPAALTTQWTAIVDHVLHHGTTHKVKFDYLSPGMGPRILEARGVPEFDEHGTVESVLSITVDVTEQETAYAALGASQVRLKFILDSARIGDWELDFRSGQIMHSLLHDRCFGYAHPVSRWSLDDLLAHVHAEDRSEVASQVERCRRTGEDLRLETRVVWPDQTVHWIALHGSLWSGACPDDRRLAGIVSDITDRKEAERALNVADRMKDEFLATLAHELRNPLAPIRNALQIMRLTDKPDVNEKARDIIDRQLSHMVHLVDDLLDVSRISQGKVELRLQRTDVVGVIQTAVETSRPLIEAGKHQLRVRLPSMGTLMVDADVTRLCQIVANLLNNAAKYTPDGGRIDVDAREQDRYAVIAVRDSGVGIPAELLPQVFDMFTQIDRTLARSQGGLGIGLALVKRLVEMHDGVVTAHSDGTGQGCRFTVRLPLATAGSPGSAAGGTPASAQRAAGRHQTRVLIVDDNIDNADTLAQIVSMMGYEILTVHDGLAAVQAAGSFLPHVVLMDIGLPLLSGHDAARQIRQQPNGHGMYLIALSGWGQQEDLNKSRSAGFDRHFVKPVDIDALMQVIAEVHPPVAGGGNPPA